MADDDNIIPLKLWGKKSDREASVHLLEYHMVDSASVCAEILRKDHRLLRTIANALGVEHNVALQSMSFLTALHDIGKVSNLFQYRNQENRSYRHDLIGYVLLTSDGFENRIVQHLMGMAKGTTRRIRRSIRDLIRASAMHHGSPSGWNCHESELPLMFREQSEIADASTVLEHIFNLYPLDSCLSSEALESEEFRSVTSLIAGLISLSDWIASDESLYPWKGDAMNLFEYRADSESIAKRIIGDDVLGIFLSLRFAPELAELIPLPSVSILIRTAFAAVGVVVVTLFTIGIAGKIFSKLLSYPSLSLSFYFYHGRV